MEQGGYHPSGPALEGEDLLMPLEMPAWERDPAEGWAGPRGSSRRGEKWGSVPSLEFSLGMVGWEVSYFFGFLGDISVAGPGAGMSMGNMSTHISRRPCKVEKVPSAPLVPPCPPAPSSVPPSSSCPSTSAWPCQTWGRTCSTEPCQIRGKVGLPHARSPFPPPAEVSHGVV